MRVIAGTSYYTFGGYPWSFAADEHGNAVHRHTFEILDSNGVAVLDLRDEEGYRIPEITTDADGNVPTFLAPHTSVDYRWRSTRWTEWCHEVSEIGEKADHASATAAAASELSTSRHDLLFYNSFNGEDGVQITDENSGGPGKGDAFGWYEAPAVFSADKPLSGSACMLVSSPETSAGVTWFDFELQDFTCVVFVRRGQWTFQGNLWWNAVHGPLYISNGYGLFWQQPEISLPFSLPPEKWVRIEARREGDVCTLSVWNDDPLRQGPPNQTASSTGATDVVTGWWLEHTGDPVCYDEWRIYNTARTYPFDIFPEFAEHQAETAIEDAERAIANAKSHRDVIPPVQRGMVNRCNGPDGEAVTVENSATYGTPFDVVSGAIVYTNDTYDGDGAMFFPDAGGLPFVRWDFEANVETASYDVVLKLPSSPTNWGSVQFTQGGRALIDPNSILADTLGGIYLQNLTNSGGVQVVASEDVPIGEWFRIRIDITASTVRCRVWFDPTGVTPDGDQTISQHSSFTAVTDAAVVLVGILCDDLVCVPGKPNYVAKLVSPVFIAHRGGSLLAPENSFEALEMCRTRGAKIVEIDVHKTIDDGLVLMHDATIDRNTAETGDPSTYSTAGVERLQLDAGSWFGSTWRNDLKVPTLDDVLMEYAEDFVLLIEVKATTGENTGQLVVDEVLRAGVENRVIIGSFTRDQLDPAISAGIPVCLFVTNASGDHAAMVSDGIAFFGFRQDASPTNVNNALSAGLKCIPYTVNRHHQRDALNTAYPGLFGMTTDDPWYLDPSYDQTLRGVPLFSSRTYHDGQIGLLPNEPWTHNPRGNFRSGPVNSIWLDTTVDAVEPNNGYLSVSLGPLCQTTGTLPDSYDITFYMENIDSNAVSNHGHLVVCATSDLEFDDNPHNVDCYVAMLRRNNTANIYRQDAGPGTATLLGSNTDFTVNQSWLRVQVRPTTIALVRTDGENGAALTTLQATDSTYRGRYVSIGVRDATVRFTNLTLRSV